MNNITDKQKCIAEQAVYGDLMTMRPDGKTILNVKGMLGTLVQHEENGEITYSSSSGCRPILRPMSDLCKETTHKGYNDDQPFIPLVEFLKAYLFGIDYTSCVILDFKIKHNVIYYKARRGETTFESDYTFAKSLVWTIKELDLAHMLHFDTRGLIGKGEAIDVNTLSNNPYTV